MKNNRRKTVDIWQEEMNRVETDRRIMLITAYLNEIQAFPEAPLPKAEVKELVIAG